MRLEELRWLVDVAWQAETVAFFTAPPAEFERLRREHGRLVEELERELEKSHA